MSKRLRSRVWVDGQVQGAIAIHVAVHWCLFAGVACVLTLAMQYVFNPLTSMSDQLQNVWRNQGPFLIVMFTLLPIFVYDTVKLSNRFAGPILRFRRLIQDIGQGKPVKKLKFRDNDFWSGLADDFNQLIERGYFSAPNNTFDKDASADSEDEDENVVTADSADLQEVS